MAKRKIIWSNKARIKLFEILEFYTERNRSTTYSKKLYNTFSKELVLLKKQPEIGIKTDYEGVRGLIVEEYILFYEIYPEMIVVHTVWNCRQNPDSLKIK
jgi:plasmid stabilization system protein ParE